MFETERVIAQPLRYTAVLVGVAPAVAIFTASKFFPIKQTSRLPSWVFALAWIVICLVFVFDSVLLAFHADTACLVVSCILIALFAAISVLWLIYNFTGSRDKCTGMMIALLFVSLLLYSAVDDVSQSDVRSVLSCTLSLVVSWVIVATMLSLTS